MSNFEFIKMQRFHVKEEKLNLGPKMLYLGVFGLQFEKSFCHIGNQFLQDFQKNKFLTILVNFGIGSAFSEGPRPGLGPLFKVPQNNGRNKIRFGQ